VKLSLDERGGKKNSCERLKEEKGGKKINSVWTRWDPWAAAAAWRGAEPQGFHSTVPYRFWLHSPSL